MAAVVELAIVRQQGLDHVRVGAGGGADDPPNGTSRTGAFGASLRIAIKPVSVPGISGVNVTSMALLSPVGTAKDAGSAETSGSSGSTAPTGR